MRKRLKQISNREKRNKLIFFVLTLFIFFNFICLFLAPDSILLAENSKDLNLYFFYSKDCSNCLELIKESGQLLKDKYSEVNLVLFELTESNDNLKLLFYLLDNMKGRDKEYEFSVPIIFIGNTVLIGKNDIDNNLENYLNIYIKDLKQPYTADRLVESYKEISSSKEKSNFKSNYITVPAVIISGLIDSINPCAIAVILFLISTLFLSHEKKRILIYGIIYIATIFIVYLGLGLGIVYLIQNIRISHLLFIIIGSFLIIIGLFSIKDFFWYGKGFSLGFPGSVKKFIEKNIYKATIFSVVLIGIVISLFEATCSGAIYLGILSIISEQGLNFKSLGFLIFYNFIFILPLIVILLVFYFGFSIKKINKWIIQKRRKTYRLVAGIILISLGIYLIVWF